MFSRSPARNPERAVEAAHRSRARPSAPPRNSAPCSCSRRSGDGPRGRGERAWPVRSARFKSRIFRAIGGGGLARNSMKDYTKKQRTSRGSASARPAASCTRLPRGPGPDTYARADQPARRVKGRAATSGVGSPPILAARPRTALVLGLLFPAGDRGSSRRSHRATRAIRRGRDTRALMWGARRPEVIPTRAPVAHAGIRNRPPAGLPPATSTPVYPGAEARLPGRPPRTIALALSGRRRHLLDLRRAADLRFRFPTAGGVQIERGTSRWRRR